MATRDIYTTTFGEGVQTTTTTCPDCGGSVRTTDRETICEDCSLILEDTQSWTEDQTGADMTSRDPRDGPVPR